MNIVQARDIVSAFPTLDIYLEKNEGDLEELTQTYLNAVGVIEKHRLDELHLRDCNLRYWLWEEEFDEY